MRSMLFLLSLTFPKRTGKSLVLQLNFFICSSYRDSVSGLRTFLLEQTAKGGDRQVLQYVTDLLNKNVGFLINERFINIPAQVSEWCLINLHPISTSTLSHVALVIYKVGIVKTSPNF